MTDDKKNKIIKASVALLSFLFAIVFIYGFSVVEKSNNALAERIYSLENVVIQNEERILEQSKRTAFAEISRSRKELLELIISDRQQISSLRSEIFKMREDFQTSYNNIVNSMQEASQTNNESSEKIEIDSEIELSSIPVEKEEIIFVVEEEEIKTPIWKKTLQFWKWF